MTSPQRSGTRLAGECPLSAVWPRWWQVWGTSGRADALGSLMFARPWAIPAREVRLTVRPFPSAGAGTAGPASVSRRHRAFPRKSLTGRRIRCRSGGPQLLQPLLVQSEVTIERGRELADKATRREFGRALHIHVHQVTRRLVRIPHGLGAARGRTPVTPSAPLPLRRSSRGCAGGSLQLRRGPR